MDDLERRLRAVEKQRRMRDEAAAGPQYCAPHLIVKRGESVEQARQRAAQEGRFGPFLVLPEPVPPEVWEAQCRRYHEIMFSSPSVSADDWAQRKTQYYQEFPDDFGAAEWRLEQAARD